MSVYLLDVNVLIALIDPNHVHHDRAHQWFAAEGVHAWATCATTENGLLRIVGILAILIRWVLVKANA